MTQNRQNSLQIYNTIDSTAERRNSESPNFKKNIGAGKLCKWVDWEIFFMAHFYFFLVLCDICLGGFFTLTFLGRRI